MGLIDTLTAGFRTVRRHIWLILLPLLLDLWLWLGPRISIGPVVEDLLTWWSVEQLPADLVQVSELYQAMLTDLGEHFNLMWLLSNNLTWLNELVPALGQPARLSQGMVPIQVGPGSMLVWAALLLVLGLGLGSFFLTSVATQVPAKDEAQDDRRPTNGAGWGRRGLRTWALLVVYGLVLLCLMLAVTAVLSIGLTVVFLVAPGLSAVFGTLVFLLMVWLVFLLYLMLYFVAASLVMDGTSLRQAIWRSVNVAMRNLWATLGLLVLTFVILNGFGLIWQRLASSGPLGVLLAIVGNAVLLAGLTAARLVFYQDRYVRWQQLAQAQQPVQT